MKFRNLLLAAIAAAFTLVGCKEKEENLGTPEVSVNPTELSFDKAGTAASSNVVALKATRDWHVNYAADSDKEWISVEPASGEGSSSDQNVTVTVLPNDGFDRSATLTFDIGFATASLVVSQEGSGSVEASIVYKNDFDVQEATKTYGTSSSSWPYLDQFEGWKNAAGTGAGAETYAFSGMSVRANSTSNGNYSDYSGSGSNNLFFGSNSYFAVTGIALPSDVNYTLSFGSEKYSQDGSSLFTHSEFHVYVSNDGTKWVELQYAFPNGDKEGRWDLASTTFTIPSGTTTLGICVKSDVASVYRLDDLTLSVASSAGTAIDFSTGIDLGFGGGDTPSDETAKGSGTLEDPYNPKAIYDIAAALASDSNSDSDYYIKGKISSVKYTFSAQYGTATFNISEDGTASGTQFPCYSVLYLGNRSWVEGDANVAVGDEVVVCGKVINYQGNTPETASRKAYIYSLNGQTSIEQSEVFGVASESVSVSASATSATVSVTGNVAWTATSDNATITPASGTGAGDITVSFEANTDTENGKTYTVVVSTTAEVATKSYTVTVTQSKASAAGTVTVTFDKSQLESAACKGASVKMDDVISFTNSSDYGTNTVTELRIYKSSTFTVTAASGYAVTGIQLTCTKEGTEKQGPGCFGAGAPEGYSYSGKVGTWAGSAQSVAFTATDQQVRVTELVVTYQAQ